MRKFVVPALLAALPAMAQPAPIVVYYVFDLPTDGAVFVDKAMRAVLARPQFLAAAKRDARLLEVAVSGKIEHHSNEQDVRFRFTLTFWRGGDKLGESAEACRLDQLGDCADQIAADIASADAIRR